MLYEIEFLPVGEGERSGDAICLRYSTDGGNTWMVGVIDGGTSSSGEALCEHINEVYGTSTVDFVICTHPDQDHASGLSQVLDNLSVKLLIMHCPWDYVDDIFDRVNDGRVTKNGLQKRLIEGHPYAYALYEKANAKRIPIYHPFSDNNHHGIPCLHIVSPPVQHYVNQLVNFRSITEVVESTNQAHDLFGIAKSAAQKAINWLAEHWDEEQLVDPPENATSAENNSSVVALFDFAGSRALLTGDAGVEALSHAADKIAQLGYPQGQLSFFQIPHHGSRRNIGPSVLNRLVGAPKPAGTGIYFHSIVSVSPNGEPKHPNKRVVNALIRRGAEVTSTCGVIQCYHSDGAPDRGLGWIQSTPLPFYERVEDDA